MKVWMHNHHYRSTGVQYNALELWTIQSCTKELVSKSFYTVDFLKLNDIKQMGFLKNLVTQAKCGGSCL